MFTILAVFTWLAKELYCLIGTSASAILRTRCSSCGTRPWGSVHLQNYVQKRSERAHFLVWPARTNLEGVGSGRGANICAYWRLRVRTPSCARPFLLLVFGDLGRKTQRAQTGGLCAVALANVASLGVGRASLFFCNFFDAYVAVYVAR